MFDVFDSFEVVDAFQWVYAPAYELDNTLVSGDMLTFSMTSTENNYIRSLQKLSGPTQIEISVKAEVCM